MAVLAKVSFLATSLVLLVVGLRLLRVWRRTCQVPELTMGVAYVLGIAGLVLLVAADSLALEAVLELGEVTIGETTVADLLAATSGDVELEAEASSLGFLAAYLGRFPWIELGGSGAIDNLSYDPYPDVPVQLRDLRKLGRSQAPTGTTVRLRR